MKHRDFPATWLLAALAALSPMAALGLHLLGLAVLPVGTLGLVVPSLLVSLVLVVRDRALRLVWLRGLVAGLIAVTVYDGFRIPTMEMGIWGDFIPQIGRWLLQSDRANWGIGYLWRYLGDGGLLGVSFFVFVALLRPAASSTVRRWFGVGFGLAIWVGLVVVAVLARHRSTGLFPLNAATVIASFIGHFIYGITLGEVSARAKPGSVWPRRRREVGQLEPSAAGRRGRRVAPIQGPQWVSSRGGTDGGSDGRSGARVLREHGSGAPVAQTTRR